MTTEKVRSFRAFWPVSKKNVLNLFLVGLTFLSAVSFSFSSLLGRLFIPKSIPNLIQFQTTCIFLAFFVQSGLRAGLRNQHYLGRHRLVEEVEKTLLWHLPWVALGISLALSFTRLEFFPAFSALYAMLTLLMTLRIAQSKLYSAAIWSVLTFIAIVAPCLLILFGSADLLKLRLPIEAFSIVGLFLLGKGKRPGKMAVTALKKVMHSCLGMHLNAFSIYFLNFLFGQYVVFLSRADLRIGVAYADVQILCGVQSLLVTRLYLLAEGRMVKGGRIFHFLVGFLLWTFLFSFGAFSVVLWKKDSHLALFYAALAFTNLGSIPQGILSQFMLEKYRLESLVITFFSVIVLAGAIHFGIKGDHAAYLIALSSPGVITLILASRSLFSADGYFIQPATARS